jgi:hypothetical protein
MASAISRLRCSAVLMYRRLAALDAWPMIVFGGGGGRIGTF